MAYRHFLTAVFFLFFNFFPKTVKQNAHSRHIYMRGGLRMLKKREIIAGAFYHVTSRTNDRIRVFENNLGRKIMLITLQDAKDKFKFRLANFCVMPTHIHLLIKPEAAANLSRIMQWIKLNSAKRWNNIHGSIDHLWGAQKCTALSRVDEKNQHGMAHDKIIRFNKCVSALADTVRR
jgi:REP element-mobilizing transposase RayT